MGLRPAIAPALAHRSRLPDRLLVEPLRAREDARAGRGGAGDGADVCPAMAS